MQRKLYSTAPYNDPRGNTMSQKVVMDRQYYNQFYKFSDSNAKLLKIRKQSRLSNSGVVFENSCSFLQPTSGPNYGAMGVGRFPSSSQHSSLKQ